MTAQDTFGEWSLRRLTNGSENGQYHQHSYYDIPVFDRTSRKIAAARMNFAGRDIVASDRITVGYVSTDDGGFTALAETCAFSLQQGPMAQWVPGHDWMIWSDRENGRLVARLFDCQTGNTRTLSGMVYALSPDGAWALSLNMDRLETLRPGYGYAGGDEALSERAPSDDGIWKLDLATGERTLIVSLERARHRLMKTIGLKEWFRMMRKRPFFWFNHAKISPDGRRFTVKLRWRFAGKPWNDSQGVSLTIASDGSDIRVLARATSHVIWEDPSHLFFYSRIDGTSGVWRIRDEAGGGNVIGQIGKDEITANVHIRKLPDSDSLFVFDTPYQPAVDLKLLDEQTGDVRVLASFGGHEPPRGPYRCDLHPVPSPDGKHIVVTSPQDGGRQLYLLSRE